MKTSKPYYFDYMASTPIAGSVKEKMIKYLDADKYYGNPASTHNIYGHYAQQVIVEAREEIADYFNSEAENWLFTSGATEAINLAIQGVAHSYSSSSKRIITFESEHAATLKCCKQLRSLGFEIVVLPVQSSGLIDLCLLEEALKTSTLLVSVLHVNNEIGVIQPIKKITDLAKKHHALVHVDAVQTVGKVKLDLLNSGIDLMSISSHKNYGPKGIGSLYISPDNNLKLKPIIFGGGQEKGLRSGTLATHQIAGMGEAYSLSKRDYDEDYNKVESLYKIFVEELIVKEELRASPLGILKNTPVTKSKPSPVNSTFDPVTPRNGP